MACTTCVIRCWQARKKGSLSETMGAMSLIDKRRQRRQDKKRGSVPTMTKKAAREFRKGRCAARQVLQSGGSHAAALSAAQEHFAPYAGSDVSDSGSGEDDADQDDAAPTAGVAAVGAGNSSSAAGAGDMEVVHPEDLRPVFGRSTLPDAE